MAMSSKAGWQDPAKGLAAYRGLRGFFLTLAAAAGLSLALFGAVWGLVGRWPWLHATAAEGLVFSAAMLVFALILTALGYWYMGRPLAARMLAEGLADPAPPASTGRLWPGWLAFAVALAVWAALLWGEYHFQASIAARRADPTTLDRAIFGEAQAPFTGVTGYLAVALLTFNLRARKQKG